MRQYFRKLDAVLPDVYLLVDYDNTDQYLLKELILIRPETDYEI